MFTLKVSYLTALLTGAASWEKLCKSFQELRKASMALETVQEEYLVVVTKDELAGEDEYLANSASMYVQGILENQLKESQDMYENYFEQCRNLAIEREES